MFGSIGDRLPDQKVAFLLSLALPASATLCFLIGSSAAVLLVARFLHGFSSAAVSTLGKTMLLNKVGHEKIGEAIGYTGMATCAGLLLGPVIGGALFELGGSRTVFVVPAAMLLAEMILRSLVIDGKSSLKKIDSPEAPNAPSESGQGVNQVNDRSGTDSKTVQEHQTADDSSLSETQPLLGRSSWQRNSFWALLTRWDIAVALFSSLLLNGVSNGFDAILPAYSMSEFNLTSSRVALLFLCLGTPMILSPLTGRLTDNYGPKVLLVSGLLCLAPCLFLLQFVDRGIPHAIIMLGILLALAGSGLCLTLQPLQVVITIAVKNMEEETPTILGSKGAYSRAYGLLNMSFAAGAMVGPICTGFLRASLGWQWTLLVMSAMPCVILSLVIPNIVRSAYKRRAVQQ